jgi:hypothetical protein
MQMEEAIISTLVLATNFLVVFRPTAINTKVRIVS